MLGLATALTLALLTTADPTGLPSSPPAQVPAATDADILAEVREGMQATDSDGFMAALAASFPDDYAAFEQRLIDEIKAGTLDQTTATSMSAEFSSAIVSRHLDRVVQAGTEDLLRLSSARMALMEALQQGHAAACHEFVEAGLAPDRTNELGLIPQQAMARLSRAVIGIISQPPQGVTHPEPPPEVWEQIGRRYAESGGDPGWLTTLFGNQNYAGQSHGERCANAVLWETAVNGAAPEVRAYYISALYVVPPAPAVAAP